jgi:spoIIIJ-associated protein
MMTPKELLDTILGYLGFVVEIEESQNEAGNLVLQIYSEESRRLIGRDGETLEALQFLLNRLIQAKDKEAPKVVVVRCARIASCSGFANWLSACVQPDDRCSSNR